MPNVAPNSEPRTPNPEPKTQNSELRTQNSELRTQNSQLMCHLHLVPTVSECNGVFQVARMLAREDGGRILPAAAVTPADLDGVEEVWVHGMWLPKEWRACRLALKAGKRLVRMTHGSLSPVYLERQGKWKKRLVAPIERRLFAQCDRVVVTGPWEEAWCRAWGITGKVETVDVKRFFRLGERRGMRDEWMGEERGCGEKRGNVNVNVQQCPPVSTSVHQCLKVMYLGMRHPLKGVGYLERAVEELNRSIGQSVNPSISQSVDPSIELRIVSDAVGEAKEAAWAWCDVLCLPTLSENFGLVVAEALERGKRVITTDGAPAWEDCAGDGRLVYLKGYRDGDDETRVRLLKAALVEPTGGTMFSHGRPDFWYNLSKC